LGNENTYNKIVSYYEKIGCFDTGIFATDILIRLLFENGNGELAVKLLTNDGAQGFEHWRRNGATTFHEYWDSNRSRSHNHPMFGAPVAYFFEYLLGIKQEEGSVSYKSLIIEPQCVTMFERMKGSIETPYGKVSVGYVNNADSTDFDITIPDGVSAVFKIKEESFELKKGVNKFTI
jgi:alpha-L-rhamnosidase